MKMTITFKATALALLLISSVACNKAMEFSQLSLQSSVSNPIDTECKATVVDLKYPTSVKQDEVFSLSLNRYNVSWTIVKGTDKLELAGSEVKLALSEVGFYSVFAIGTDSCGVEDGYEFFITVNENDVVETPEVPEVPEIPETPEIPEPELPETPEVPELPEIPEVPETPEVPEIPEVPEVPETPVTSGKADILFVVHNTQSMFSELREAIPYRFAEFISKLDGDYRIGVTSADVTGSRAYESGGLADVLRTPVSGPGIALVPKQKVITSAMGVHTSRNFLATIMRPEAICIQVVTARCPPTGSGWQQGIEAAKLAINKSESQGLFRDDAALHVVIIADKDQSGGDQEAPEKFIAAVQAKWPGKKLKVHTVIYQPEAAYCNAHNVSASKAPIYSKLSKLTGGVTANFCASMDRKDINSIAAEINK